MAEVQEQVESEGVTSVPTREEARPVSTMTMAELKAHPRFTRSLRTEILRRMITGCVEGPQP